MTRFLFAKDFASLLREEIERGKSDEEARVLNIACEENLVPDFLPKRIQARNIFGIEINRQIVERVPNIRYADVDADRFPFENGSFDFALSIWGIEHFKSSNVFREAYRVLKPGGRFIFITPNLAHPIFLASRFFGEWIGKWYYKRIIRSSYRPHPAYYRFNTVRAIRRAARDAKFKKSDLVYLGPASVIGYFAFSRAAQKMVTGFEKYLLTNRLLGRFKPYFLAILEK